jgi:ATP-dependent helicase/nuclease subunit A
LDKAQSSGKITLSDFTAYLSDLSEREVREGDAALDVAGVVQLMTVHASKGLEFPVVVLVEAHWKRGGGGRSADLLTFKDGFGCKVPLSDGKWGKPYAYQRAARLQALREDAERRRLLYVAATRAQDMLIVSGMAKPAKDDPERLQADGWLGWLIEALESSADSDLSDVALNLRRDPPTLRHRRDSDADDPESPLLFNTILPAKVASIMPPLLSAVRPRQQRQARHLAAASIADLGGSFQADDPVESLAARARFRRKVLYEAPSVIARVRPDSTYRLGAINVGDIVHEALRWWRLPFDTMDSNTQQDLLYSYAWENGVTDAEATRVAVERAQQLLTKFSQSALYRWTREAQAAGKPIYRELPFIYERDTHIVHGVIDILFQRANGTWVLADYKTSRIGRTARRGLGGGVQVYEALAVHARRYHLQVGVYAEAAQAQLNGILPSVFIHYISYATSVEIPTATWREALAAGLGTPIAQVMQSP